MVELHLQCDRNYLSELKTCESSGVNTELVSVWTGQENKPMRNEHEHEINIRASSSGMMSQDQFKMQYIINTLMDIGESIKTKPNLK